ncbi:MULTISPECIES: FAD:protein FMN transferase [Alicyclobacillus]|uniref:FAD:protein FMN transferase n=1 Tax=Alicyclobacillus acidoterrestris (strain ATCC 49025 / DSM 3922 / CIP 106132 / NCIMB 13137 / GD3B) TaxID=1356854 RepID=T0CIR4_ALIAG|nr:MULTISPECIES: FAD:protein FMN transferase [Alicyclobacillus]EPZ52694.1 hypothetical protein N007_02590 [Alicyclobacillus acidoterrestris ATCC 49025]UNO48906.1 FAD:protein FMN transferase [Alicyclobacillus acidoterrestris]
MTSRTFRAMGTDIYMEIPNSCIGDDFERSRILADAARKMTQLESIFTRFHRDSDLNHINHSTGKWIQIRPCLYEVLQLAKDFFVTTRGLFNPCLGAVMKQLGYSVPFEQIDDNTVRPVIEIPYVSPMHCPFDLRIQGTEYQVWLEPGYQIDLGGIAKGWIVQQIASDLRSVGVHQFVCNAGGDVICDGYNGTRSWSVGIRSPFDTNDHILLLDIHDLAVATSGTYKRTWKNHGQTVHHIIDPFLGVPVQSDMISCSVIHRNLVTAEVQAKVALIMGTEKGIPWLNNQDCAGWVIITQNGTVVKSCNL